MNSPEIPNECGRKFYDVNTKFITRHGIFVDVTFTVPPGTRGTLLMENLSYKHAGNFLYNTVLAKSNTSDKNRSAMILFEASDLCFFLLNLTCAKL